MKEAGYLNAKRSTRKHKIWQQSSSEPWVCNSPQLQCASQISQHNIRSVLNAEGSKTKPFETHLKSADFGNTVCLSITPFYNDFFLIFIHEFEGSGLFSEV